MKQHVIVIGGGFAGLSTAALLAKKGYKVTLLEKNSGLGGRARVLKTPVFQFDMGPSWYMMPEVFERFFSLFGHRVTDFYKLKLLNPRYRCFYSDKTIIDLSTDLVQNTREFEKVEKGSGQKLTKYLDQSSRLYDLAAKKLIYQPFTSVLDFLRPKNLLDELKILTILNPLQSIEKFTASYFKNDKLKQILEFPTVFLGGSPFVTPALYMLMSSADFKGKIWYPEGGMIKVVEALEKLCLENGVKIYKNSEVKKIVVVNQRATGVIVNRRQINADLIVSGADYPHTEIDLLDKEARSYDRDYWQKKTLSISCMILYLGLKEKLKSVLHHNLFMSGQWQAHFDSIFVKKDWPEDPSFYVSVRTKSDAPLAPKGYEELFVLVPLAVNLNDTDQKRQQLADLVIKRLEEYIGEKVEEKIIYQKIYSHRDFINDYHAYQGTALGLAHTLDQTLILRPANQSPKVKNLFYGGQFTQPGVGVPMEFISAEIVTQLIEKKYGR